MLQTRHSPIIVGERYELAETADQGGEHHGGLLAKSEYQTALLSMSNYGRHASSDLNSEFCCLLSNLQSLSLNSYESVG